MGVLALSENMKSLQRHIWLFQKYSFDVRIIKYQLFFKSCFVLIFFFIHIFALYRTEMDQNQMKASKRNGGKKST